VIREFEPADAPALIGLFREIVPEWVVTERGLLHWVDTEREASRLAVWVAYEGGRLAGWGEAGIRWEFGKDAAYVFGGVRSDARGRGLGGRLDELAETHVSDAARLYSFTVGDDAGRGFLLARGFREDLAESISVLDPRTVDSSVLPELEAAKAAEGFRVVPLRELGERASELHRLFETVADDAPSSEPLVPIRFEEFRERFLANPDLDHDASAVVLGPDGRAVALSWLLVDGEGGRAMVEMTGTLREFRRRGLARLAKLATIRWAAEHGITAMYTGNDTENRAMLALNDELGFEPRIVHQDFVKELR
jgi:GNAT superfamily N-acetyltransferase